MSGLNFLLWTIAVLIILGVVAFIGIGIFAYCKRNKMVEEYNKQHPSFLDRLKETQRKQEEMLKQANNRAND